MRRTIYALVSVLALAGSATPAMGKTVTQCIIEAVADCDARFPVGDRFATAIRGWCYLINTGMCKAME